MTFVRICGVRGDDSACAICEADDDPSRVLALPPRQATALQRRITERLLRPWGGRAAVVVMVRWQLRRSQAQRGELGRAAKVDSRHYLNCSCPARAKA